MIFTDEYALIDNRKIESSFSTQNTQFNVVQGAIDAIVTKSGVDKMQTGDRSLWDQLGDLQVTSDNIHAAVAEMNTYEVDGSVVSLTSKIANMDIKSSSIELAVSDIAADYTTGDDLNRAISEHRAKIVLDGGTVKITTDNYNGQAWQSSSVDIGKSIRLETTGPISWQADNSTMTNTGYFTCTGGEIAGWRIINQKICGGDASTGVAVMQLPLSNIHNVFAAGGKRHDDYDDCPFRVTKAGKVYAEDIDLSGYITSVQSANNTSYCRMGFSRLEFGNNNYTRFYLNNDGNTSRLWSNQNLSFTSPQIVVGTDSEAFQCRNSAYYYLPVQMNSDGTVQQWQQVRFYHGLLL